MLFSLADSQQTVLLTGASEGMGKSVAIQLAQKGANIIIVARNVGKLEEALNAIKVRLSCAESRHEAHNTTRRLQQQAQHPNDFNTSAQMSPKKMEPIESSQKRLPGTTGKHQTLYGASQDPPIPVSSSKPRKRFFDSRWM